MLLDLIQQLEERGLREVEHFVTSHSGYTIKWTFEGLVEQWNRFVDMLAMSDQFSMGPEEYAEYLHRRILLLKVQMLLSYEARKISDQIIAPLDEIYFQETMPIEKPLVDAIPDKYFTFFYRIPKRKSHYLLTIWREYSIIDE